MSRSSFAPVGLAIVNLLRSGMPPGVEVTTLSPKQAGIMKTKQGRQGRVNVALFRVEMDPSPPNVPARPSQPGRDQPKANVQLSYLISANATTDPAADGGAPHLLECAIRVLVAQPVQLLSVTDAAGVKTGMQITLTIQPFSLAEMTALWTAMQTGLQASIVCLAKPVMVGSN
jgi:hypothetical protein